MDSRLKKQVIAVAVLMITLVVAMVVGANYIQKQKSIRAGENATGQEPENVESGDRKSVV